MDEFRDVRAADAGGNFEEVKLAVGVPFDKFGVGGAAGMPQRLDDLSVEADEFLRFRVIIGQGVGHEYAAVMADGQRRAAIARDVGEHGLAVHGHRIDVVDLAGDELLQHAERLLVAQLLD